MAKFIVIKEDNANEVMKRRPDLIKPLVQFGDELLKLEVEAGRNPNKTYIVVNEDEPYFDEIKEVLKRHGHWEE